MSEPHLEGAREIARTLREHGHLAYFAGGCVRDLLLGSAPKDYDVVTDALPEEVSRIFRRTVQVGAAFGVVRVLWTKKREYEVATFRTERGYSDGRRPDEVQYSASKEEDVARRDFTINALLMEPETGEILDFVGGRADLERGLIRAVGSPSLRFAEDRLRMLRAVRFAARFGFTIERETREAIRAHAPAIGAVSAERITAELEAIWCSPRPGLGLRLLAELGLAQTLLPFLEPLEHERLDRATAQLDRLPAAAADLGTDGKTALAWSALLHPAVPPVDPEEVLRGFKLPRDRLRTVQRLLERRALLLAPDRASQAERVRVLIDVDTKVQLAYLEILTGAESAERRRFTEEAVELQARPLPPMPVLTGQDLLSLGLTPGPEFKALLAGIEVEVLERRIQTKAQALNWVRLRLGETS
ncbi:MAG: CCA tRNA nucleotidyltransferase [Deltaproteobacteria bacterium]|nr:CCA tRNA nucleotidyltransferase [Deltaproteobacteria bacterium]